MNEAIATLEQEIEQYTEKRRVLLDKRKQRTDELIAPIEQQIFILRAQAMREFAGQIEDVESHLAYLNKELVKAKLDAAKSHKSVGQRFVFWSRNISGYRNTGKIGVIDVYDGNTLQHYSGWSRPKIGDLYIRNVLKSGSPGMRLVGRVYILNGVVRLSSGWYPEGVDPNKGAV